MLIIVNGHVWTGDPSRPRAEAVAIRDDRIIAVGRNDEIESTAGPDTMRVDAGGGLVTPGFIDSHVHFIAGGFRLSSVQLRDAATPARFADRIGTFATSVPPGTWITGGDWDHHLWGGELPRRDWIDRLTPDHPVWVSRHDGHMGLANTRALEIAGITAATPDVPGGTIERDGDGMPTGLLKDNAMALVTSAIPSPPASLEDRALDAAMRYVAACGVTSIHHVGTWNDLSIFERARDAGRLTTRIYAAVPLPTWERLRDHIREHGTGDEWLKVGALKEFVDGSLGSHTAAFLEPYTDAPDDSGLLVAELPRLRERALGADRAGIQLAIHAIGDRAIRELLDVFEVVASTNGPRDRRFRIEHAQHVDPDDLRRFALLGVIASAQPYHAIDDGRWAEAVIGPERARMAFPWRSLIDAGVPVAFGSDWHVAPPTPLEGIHAAVTRSPLDGSHPAGWIPEQQIGLEEALKAYTHTAAFASFDEHLKGTLTPGRVADITIIDRDLFTIPPDEIRNAKVRMTIAGGRIVFDAAQH